MSRCRALFGPYTYLQSPMIEHLTSNRADR
jgi:hypothetical protein